MKPGRRISKPQGAGLAILLLWGAAAALIFAQYQVLSSFAEEFRTQARSGHAILYVPADRWRVLGVLGPLALIAIGLFMQRSLPSALLRKLGGVGLIVMVPVTLLAVLIASAGGPAALGSAGLPSGTQYVLALEPIPTDSVYTLYQPSGFGGFWWREVAHLDYSEDGRFIGGEKIVLSPDARWLLVARAGLWTDCFRLIQEKPVDCGISIHPSWIDASYETDMRARSLEIQRLTRLVPPKPI
ncbi:hypothetical protein ACCC88_07285 [Sphingomonas sp. Sphisp140]|uniref:hypothetical protein n=1 Tax=unclassified Sphingomonas TaxID=196159 RepID=UPI0039AEDF6B